MSKRSTESLEGFLERGQELSQDTRVSLEIPQVIPSSQSVNLIELHKRVVLEGNLKTLVRFGLGSAVLF